MKKTFLLTILTLILLGAGCVPSVSGTISVQVDKENYDINELNKFAYVSIDITNNSNRKIYHEDTCGSPVRFYEKDGNEWKKTNFGSVCFGLTDGLAKPMVLKSGENFIVNESIPQAGVYRAEFVYYLSESDFEDKENGLSIFSNEFTVSRVSVNLQTVFESCQHIDEPTRSRIDECLYLAAKSAVYIQNLDLALDLCAKIRDRNSNFDGCYDGVALKLSQDAQNEKVELVCRNYNTPERIQQCIDMAK